MSKAKVLRGMLERKEVIFAPGAFDCVSAKLIERTGFHAAYMTGYGVSASLIGKPDIGLISLQEMVQQAGNIASSIAIPLIADADTGYGNELNVARTVELYERNQVAAIQLEDQGFPKKCGHMENKTLIPADEAARKIKAATKARNDPDTLIIARTDARSVLGLDEAIERAKRYADAGADILFVEAPLSLEELQRVADELKGMHLMANMVETGKTPLLMREQLADMGYSLIIWPITTLLTAVKAMERYLLTLRDQGISSHDPLNYYSFQQFVGLLGLSEYHNFATELMKED